MIRLSGSVADWPFAGVFRRADLQRLARVRKRNLIERSPRVIIVRSSSLGTEPHRAHIGIGSGDTDLSLITGIDGEGRDLCEGKKTAAPIACTLKGRFAARARHNQIAGAIPRRTA
jgi:hypothetical protein